ncbi:hypothetical protein [Sphingomonas sp.]|uniref:hypothetical protein n=1 Tax=Sphingomonas sp. TaxID=28214 RepID=UPI002D7E7756|nr:hypothetical protein [Sphingomonas sp.]HEU0044541.1 hypothetical protein [Sphingomonas sp.]
MANALVFVIAGVLAVAASDSATAQSRGVAAIEQIDSSRSSATVQRADAERVAPAVSAKVLAVCQEAQAADRPAPAGVDCVRALQVTAAKAAPSAEGSLLNLLGQSSDVTATSQVNEGSSTNADQVSRQLANGDVGSAASGDAAASVARDRAPPPSSTPPPR